MPWGTARMGLFGMRRDEEAGAQVVAAPQVKSVEVKKEQAEVASTWTKGVRLVGFDVPDVIASEDKLRVIAAVECRDAELAPSLVSLVVRDEGPEGTKVSSEHDVMHYEIDPLKK